jgi:hypothetical protein
MAKQCPDRNLWRPWERCWKAEGHRDNHEFIRDSEPVTPANPDWADMDDLEPDS